MQITHVEVTPTKLDLRVPYRAATHPDEVEQIDVVFVRIETREGRVAWGCAAFDPALTGETLDQVLQACKACAERVKDLNPLNTEFALAELAPLTESMPSVRCAFDIAFYDLLGLAAGLPLHRLLGGYRYRIQTSITISLRPVKETVEMARNRARQGFRIIKLKGGIDPWDDVERVQAVHRALPNIILRLDAEQGYTVQEALDVSRALRDELEILEQPTPADQLDALQQVTQRSPVPILADESLTDPASALRIAERRAAHGMSVKLATCGGLHCGRQVDAIARAAQMMTLVGCINEPALLIAAGLGMALSSPNVSYVDLDGHFDLVDDPTRPGFDFEQGWLVARDVPGLGCMVEL
ncbi:MAG: mandelate racemase/muconate lactonizing enzyme family protein [Anaerolineae bacterium]|jgi:L-alanine-DL-glutamate epimerase-like enolase superfamily enzyme